MSLIGSRAYQYSILMVFVTTLFLTQPAFSKADPNQWVPIKLSTKARDEFDTKAEARIDAWRDIMMLLNGRQETAQLEEINRFFNRAIPFQSDETHWKLIDYWATPFESLATNGGDCEDYVIAKYYSLVALGVDPDKLRITYVKALRLNQAHMVLTYFPSPDAIPLVLDNLTNRIISADKRTDLDPVYSFNGNGLWLEKMKGRGVRMGNPNKLDLWTDLRVRMNQLGMNL